MNGLDFSWHWSPIILGGLLALCLLYFLAVRHAKYHTINAWHIIAFVAAMIIMVVVFLTPLDTIARTQLFTAHMLQAVALTTLCAPLLLFSSPSVLWHPIVRHPLLISPLNGLTQPLVASIIFNATFLVWHAPGLYNATVAHGTLYHLQLLIFLLTALLNWWPLIGPLREMRHLSYPIQMLYAFLDGQPVDIFAFLLVFTGVAFYPHYALPQQLLRSGYTAVADQEIGGACLLIPGLIDLVVMSPLFFRWLGQIEAQAKIADQQREGV